MLKHWTSRGNRSEGNVETWLEGSFKIIINIQRWGGNGEKNALRYSKPIPDPDFRLRAGAAVIAQCSAQPSLHNAGISKCLSISEVKVTLRVAKKSSKSEAYMLSGVF